MHCPTVIVGEQIKFASYSFTDRNEIRQLLDAFKLGVGRRPKLHLEPIKTTSLDFASPPELSHPVARDSVKPRGLVLRSGAMETAPVLVCGQECVGQQVKGRLGVEGLPRDLAEK